MSDTTPLIRNLRAEAKGHSSNEFLQELFEEAADEIVALREAAFNARGVCKCGAEAWCACLEHTVDGCPGTPLVGLRSGMQPSHIPEGTQLCPICHGERTSDCPHCEGKGWIPKEEEE